ncbi:M1 family metallopeptidase [Cyclobacterium marinum]|uniref:M1 family metallopeptidase n=1 Tax=Cyclobacterium marinum TaxID=104 RepID=UPI0011ECEAFA|nr:M1 family metallopeptidase [Cyclobacterium marinum]MBI0400379.1 M1 family metallopeptidase [Cyclobacterium marinum]
MKKITVLFLAVMSIHFLFDQEAFAQSQRWQQSVSYQMDIEMDVKTNQYTGKQTIAYSNNSPDTLNQLFFHLYYNAFQPNSMMDVRSRSIKDPDRRVGDRISKLTPDEIGFIHVESLLVNGQTVEMEEVGTILEVKLTEPIMPHITVLLESEFTAQVPLQIRRAGRDNAEGIRYSMSQWYPKLANYDEQGWHANPYIGREFYGIWGDFDVKITIDKSYILGGTGYLQNKNEIGFGYEDEGVTVKKPSGSTLTWHFYAPKVHDFMWAADPKYTHEKLVTADGITLHHLYVKSKETKDTWPKLKEYTAKTMAYLSERYGTYPYKQYSVIQGGDGGMEYPMATLITGHRPMGSLVGVMMHELAHSWFQGVLASNESLYPWMDEGFTTYASTLSMADNYLKPSAKGPLKDSPLKGAYVGYERLVESGLEEPLSTHADHFHTNTAYGSASYSKGALFLAQLGYIIGEETRNKAMLRYWETWKFKHPNVNDFIRIMEKESGIELDWYKEYWVNSTKTIDYAISTVNEKENNLAVVLERKGQMPMPIDLIVTYENGEKESYYFPLAIMRGGKASESNWPERVKTTRWPWTNETVEINIDQSNSKVTSIQIDPSERMADIDKSNNLWTNAK